MLKNDTVLFPVRKAHWYVPKRPLGCGEPGCVGSQGDGYYVAPNPDFGATFTYYLPEAIQTQPGGAPRGGERARERKPERHLRGLGHIVDGAARGCAGDRVHGE